MSTQNTTFTSEKNLSVSAIQESELKEALTIVELEERFEMTAVAADSSRCTLTEAQ